VLSALGAYCLLRLRDLQEERDGERVLEVASLRHWRG
jgi:hypothetical protein